MCRLSRRQDDGTKPPLGSRFCLWHHLSNCLFQAWDCEGPACGDRDMFLKLRQELQNPAEVGHQELSEICPRLPKYCRTKQRFSTRWVSVGFSGFQWVSVGFSGFQWVSVGFRVSACEANIQEHQLHALKQGGNMGRSSNENRIKPLVNRQKRFRGLRVGNRLNRPFASMEKLVSDGYWRNGARWRTRTD